MLLSILKYCKDRHFIVMKAVCGRCDSEYSIEQYEKGRFCMKCGTFLSLVSEDRVSESRDLPQGSDRDRDFIYDQKKAVSIGRTLHDEFQGKTGYFEGYEMPEYILPEIEEGSRALALYYTFVIAVDYQTNAENLWRNSRRQYNLHPELFEPKNILALQDDELVDFVRSLGARFPTNGAKAWKRVSELLISRYGNDPRNITPKAMRYLDLKRRLDPFPYLRGGKVGTLYMRVMGEKGLFKIEDLDRLDVAVDVQVSRFTFYTGVLKPIGPMEGGVQSDPIKPAIERIWRHAAREVGCAPWQLDEPIWTLASTLCTNKRCGSCPVQSLCERVFEVRVKGNVLKYAPSRGS